MMKHPHCIFCQIVEREEGAEIVYQDDEITAFRDINPQAPKHILIIPNRHIRSLAQIEAQDALLLSRMIQVANDLALKEGIATRGYRLVINCGPEAGQSVHHLHLHLLGGRPMRWPPG